MFGLSSVVRLWRGDVPSLLLTLAGHVAVEGPQGDVVWGRRRREGVGELAHLLCLDVRAEPQHRDARARIGAPCVLAIVAVWAGDGGHHRNGRQRLRQLVDP